MKKLLLPLILLVFWVKTFAQPTDFNSVIQAVEVKSKDFGEYLVQLAWVNYPENQIKNVEIKQAKDKLRLAKKDWLKDFQLTVNLNESNLAPGPDLPNFLINQQGSFVLDASGAKIPLAVFDSEGNSIPLRSAAGSAFYPRYNFGLNFNLGNLIAQKNKNQVAQHDVKIAEHELNKQKLSIRSEVLTRYQKYRLAREILKARTQVEQDANANFLLVKELYSKDERTFEDYNEASSNFHESREARIKAEADVIFARIVLEEIVGLRWEQVQHPQKDVD